MILDFEVVMSHLIVDLWPFGPHSTLKITSNCMLCVETALGDIATVNASLDFPRLGFSHLIT